MHIYIIEEQSLCGMPIPIASSWVIRKMFNLRRCCQPFINDIMGNSRIFSIARIIGTLGPLADKFGDNVGYNLGLFMLARVDSIIGNEGLRWSRARNGITKENVGNTPRSSFGWSGFQQKLRFSQLNQLGKLLEYLSGAGLAHSDLV